MLTSKWGQLGRCAFFIQSCTLSNLGHTEYNFMDQCFGRAMWHMLSIVRQLVRQLILHYFIYVVIPRFPKIFILLSNSVSFIISALLQWCSYIGIQGHSCDDFYSQYPGVAAVRTSQECSYSCLQTRFQSFWRTTSHAGINIAQVNQESIIILF